MDLDLDLISDVNDDTLDISSIGSTDLECGDIDQPSVEMRDSSDADACSALSAETSTSHDVEMGMQLTDSSSGEEYSSPHDRTHGMDLDEHSNSEASIAGATGAAVKPSNGWRPGKDWKIF